MTIQSAFSRALWVPQALQPPPPVAAKNWNPGDWIASGTDGLSQDAVWDNPGIAGKVLGTRGIWQRLTAVPQYRGALIRYSWDQLERNDGEYDWTETINGVVYKRGMSQVAERLAQIAGLSGKRLIIFIQMKTFGSGNHAVPLFIRNAAGTTYKDGKDYYQTSDETGTVVRLQGSLSGEYAYVSGKVPPGPGGYVVGMHIDAVRVKFIRMMTEFASRFNNNPALEAIAVTEASIASPAGSEGPATQNYPGTPSHPAITHVTRPNTDGAWPGASAWFNNMKVAYTSMRASLSNIQICQWINADRADMEPWVPLIMAEGIGVGVPDFCKDDRGFNFTRSSNPAGAPGNLYWMNQNPNDHIRMVHFSKPAMEGSVLTPGQDGTFATTAPGQYAFPGLPWTRTEAAGFATTVVPATHRLWRHMENLKHVDNVTYAGQYFNEVTDAQIANVVATYPLENKARPTGWT